MPLDEQQQARAWAIVAGLIGGMLRLPFERKLTWMQATGTTMAGGACAIFFAPPVNNLIPGHSLETLCAVSFLFGLTGMTLCRSIILVSDKRAPELIEEGVDAARDRFLPRLRNGAGGGEGSQKDSGLTGDTENSGKQEGDVDGSVSHVTEGGEGS